MKAREHNPLRLDVEAFAKEGAELAGQWPFASMARLQESTLAASSSDAGVRWQARGELRARRAAAPEIWLHVRGETEVALQCQRCLEAMAVPLVVERSFLFAADEAAAAELDADSEDDVLVLTRSLNLGELVEDELLLALPLVPRHARCPAPLPQAGAADAQEEAGAERPNPFAALAALKGRTAGH